MDLLPLVSALLETFSPALATSCLATLLGSALLAPRHSAGLRWDSAATYGFLAEAHLAGLVAVSLGLILLALGGWFHVTGFVVLLALLLSAAGGAMVSARARRRRERRSDASRTSEQKGCRETRGALLVPFSLTLTVVGMLLLSLLPPHGFDALNYHLPFAQAFAEAGGLLPLEHLRFPVFPPLGELFQALAWMLGGDSAAKVMALIPTFGVTALCFTWARKRGTSSAGGLAVAVWLGQPLVVWLSGQAYIELWVVLFATGGLYWVDDLCHGNQSLGTATLAVGSLTAACATKYLGLVVVPLASLWLLVAHPARWRLRFGAALALGAATLLLAVPVYWWIADFTGNPVFPYLEAVFGSAGEWSAGVLAPPGGAEFGEPLGEKLLWLFALPWSTGFAREQFSYTAMLSPWWLPLFGLILWAARRDRTVALLLGAAFAYAAALLLHDERRLHHLLPPAAWLSVAAGLSLAEWIRRLQRGGAKANVAPTDAGPAARFPIWRDAGALTLGCFLFLLSPGLLYGWNKVVEGGPPPVSEASRESWLGEHLAGYSAVKALRAECLADEVRGPDGLATRPELRLRTAQCTTYLWSLQPLRHYLPGRVVGDLYGPYRPQKLRLLFRLPEAFEAQLNEWGLTHLVVPPPLADLLLRQGNKLRLEKIWFDDEVTVLRRIPATDRVLPEQEPQ